MTTTKIWRVAGVLVLCAVVTTGCDDDEPMAGSDGGATSTTGTQDAGGTTGTDAGGEKSLCEKYGGADSVESVIKTQVIGAIAADCRINMHFTALPMDRFTRVQDCLAIQAQELFGCDGITYAGSEASNGLECRTMSESHAGLGISQGDFDALIEDVVAGLSEAGVESQDIEAAAPALLGMAPDIVEAPEEDDPTMDACSADGGA